MLEQNQQTTVGANPVREYHSNTVNILMGTAIFLVAALSMYLVFFEGSMLL